MKGPDRPDPDNEKRDQKYPGRLTKTELETLRLNAGGKDLAPQAVRDAVTDLIRRGGEDD